MTLTAERPADIGEPAGAKHVPGEPGVWFLLFGDMTVFMVLFAVYLDQRGKDHDLVVASQASLNRDLGALNTLVLLVSSLLVVLAMRALRSDAHRALAPRLLLGAMACGLCFIVVKAFEYHELLGAGQTPNTNQFYMYYFVLTGLHLAHLVAGLLVLTGLVVLSRRPGMTRTQRMLFESGTCFWHMVDLLWIMIFPLLFLVR